MKTNRYFNYEVFMKKLYVLLTGLALLDGTLLLGASDTIIAATGCPISLQETKESQALLDEQKALAEKSQGCLVDLNAAAEPAQPAAEKKEAPAEDTKKEKKRVKKTANSKKNAVAKTDAQPSEKTEELELDALIKEALS